jgi:two-component system phosphate regulon sensor histidine kinase PhoR
MARLRRQKREVMVHSGRLSKLPQLFSGLRVKQEGISKYVGLILIIGALLAIAGATIVFIRAAQRRHINDLLTHGTTLTRLLARAAAPSMARGHGDELQRLVRAVQNHHLAYAVIVDTAGRIVAHTDARQRGRAFEPQAVGNPHTGLDFTTTAYKDPVRGHTIWHFAMPIDTVEPDGGSLHLGLYAQSPRTTVAQLTESISLIALMIFLVVPIVYYCLRRLLRPMQHLHDRLAQLTASAQIQPLEASYPGEVGTLVQHWNQAITQLKESMEAIKETNFALELTANVIGYEKRRLEILLDRLSDAILITDASGKVIFANRITVRLLHTTLDQIIGKSLHDCFPHKEIHALLANSADMGHNVQVMSTEISFDAYESETFKVTFSFIIDNDEKFIGSFLLIRNITQQKIAEKARGEFISAVSHELKNPLSTIKAYIEMLINQIIDDNTTKYEFYNTINDETDRMVRLIDNLLNLSKIELGILLIKPGRVRMKQFLTDCFRAVEPQATAKGIAFTMHLYEKLSALEVDKDLLSVVVMNLLSNALKYTPAGGEVALLAEETREEMLIHVRDSGIGIAETDLPHVFERFYRGQNGDKASGSGLGLALAQQIMHLHGGAITVVSEVQQDSQFTLTLPKQQHALQPIGTGRQTYEDSDS